MPTPLIRCSVRITDLLEANALSAAIVSNTLDLLRAGVILTDADATIAFANRTAAALLDGDIVTVRRGRLSACNRESAAELRDAIASAGSGTTGDIPRAGLSVVAKAENGRDLAIWALPLDSGLRCELGGAVAASVAVFIRELGDTSPFPAELFIRRYGITPAECRLLVLLTQGQSVKDAADTLGISMPTARTHLAHLLAKTGTQSQADLMRLAISALAPAASR